MLEKNRSYEVKEWMANKVANEVGRNISMCDVFAVLKETEKAVYAMLSLGTMSRKCMWIPKSALESYEVGTDPVTQEYHHETLWITDYDEAVAEFTSFWKMYM